MELRLVVVVHNLFLTLLLFADRVGIGLLGPKNQFVLAIPNILEYIPLHIFL